jgi:hypothetical protein
MNIGKPQSPGFGKAAGSPASRFTSVGFPLALAAQRGLRQDCFVKAHPLHEIDARRAREHKQLFR